MSLELATDTPSFRVIVRATPPPGAPMAMWKAWVADARAWGKRWRVAVPEVEDLARKLEQHAGRRPA